MTNTNNKEVRPSFVAQLQKHWKLILGGLIIGSVIGAAMTLNKHKDYTSSATIIFPTNAGGKMAMIGGPAAGGSDLPSMPLLDGVRMIPQPGTSGATAMMLLQSHRATSDITDNINNSFNPAFKPKNVIDVTTDAPKGVATKKTQPPTYLMDYYKVKNEGSLQKVMGTAISLKVGKNGELIVSATDADPKNAMILAQTVVDELGTLTDDLRLDPASESMNFLNKQVDDATTKLDSAQKALVVFQKENNIVSLPDQARALATQYAQIKDDVIQAELAAQIAKDQYKKASKNAGFMIEKFVDPTSSTGGGGSLLAPLYKKVQDLESEKAMLLTKLTESHPDVQSKNDQLVDARKMLDAEVQRQKELLKGDVSPGVMDLAANTFVTGAKVDGLKVALKKMESQVQTLPEQEGTYARLSADVDASAEAVKLYRTEVEKARILAGDRGHVFEVLDPPELPTEANPQGRLKTVAIFALLGLFLPMALPALKFSRELQEYEDSLLLKAEQAPTHEGCPFMKEIQQQQDIDQ